MFNGTSGYSLADIAAATGGSSRNSDNGGWGDGGAWWIIILFLFVFCGWGGNGFGGFGGGNAGTQGALTRGDLCMDMNFNDLQGGVRAVNDAVNLGFANLNSTICNQQYDTARMINGVQGEIASGFAGVDNAVCTLGYQTQAGINSINMGNMQNTNTLLAAINGNDVNAMQNTYAITNAINAADINAQQNATALSTQLAQCCCDNKAALADIKYTMATDSCALQTSIANSTRDMIDNQNANTRSILDFLVQDKISSLENENQALRLSASQQAQNNYLVSTLRPAPVPAFAVPAPYQFSGCGGCGFNTFNNGCGCC